MAEFTKLAMESATLTPSCDVFGLEQQMSTQKISVVSDQTNGFHHKNEKSDSFVLDIESFSHVTDRDITPNSRITRSLSRKGSQRGGGGEKKTSSNATGNEKDTIVASSSPRAALVGAGTPESPVAVVVGTTDHLSSHPQAHHQITITAGNISSTGESKGGFRRNSFRRSPSSWTIDPRKILFLFATLSSMGTILLIYFTLSMSKINEGDVNALN